MWADVLHWGDVWADGLAAVGLLLVAALHAGYAVYLWRSGLLRQTPDRSARVFLLAVLVTAAWGAAGWIDLGSSKRFTWHLALLFDQLRYGAWLLFLVLLLRPMVGTLASGGLRLGRAALTALVLVGLLVNVIEGLWPGRFAVVAWLLVAGQLATAVVGLLLVEQFFRNQADPTRWSAKPLSMALGGLFMFDVYLFSQALMFGGFDADVLAARALVHALTTPLLLMASRRHAKWLARMQVSKTAAFYSASLLLIGGYLLFIASAGYYVRFFGGSWGGALQVVLLFGAMLVLLLLLLSGAMRSRLRVFLGKNFFSYRYDYRLEWLRFTAMLSTEGNPQEVGALVVRGLAEMVESPGGGLWFKALGDDRYVQLAARNLPDTGVREPVDSAFCQLMHEREWILDLNAARRRRGPELESEVLPAWLAQLDNAWLAVPLLVGDEMLGFVVLAQPRTPVELNWEVRDLLKTAARQAAGFLAQMHATEALLEARKFDAFNRMSAFVVHDLKNIITQLSLMMKNAQRHRDNPEFQQDMLLTVESSLDKMRQLMVQLREGQKPVGVSSGVELAPLLQRITDAASQRGRQVDLDVVDRIATRGHEDRLERVIGHVVQNALDATPASGRVWVTLRQVSGRAQVVVGDTGAGMSAEFIQNRLFRPFNSTKSSGMGIGSYESFSYLKELGGSIDVKSEVGQGSEISLLMPLFDQRTTTDLRKADAA